MNDRRLQVTVRILLVVGILAFLADAVALSNDNIASISGLTFGVFACSIAMVVFLETYRKHFVAQVKSPFTTRDVFGLIVVVPVLLLMGIYMLVLAIQGLLASWF
jgi:hypothetical protein